MTNTRNVDILVIGSGAAGVSAAIYGASAGKSVMLCEKAAKIGGTTALSNAMIWVPCSHQAKAAGIADSLEKARTYLRGELGNYYDEKKIDTFLERGPEAVREIEQNSEIKFVLAGTPDYHSSREGGVEKGRSLSPLPYDGRLLGKDFDLIGDPIRVVLGGMMITSSEIKHFLNPFKSMTAIRHVIKRVGRFAMDRLKYARGTELSGGNAFLAAALISLRKLGVELVTECPMAALVVEDGRVTGALMSHNGEELRVTAKDAVILATGGFAANAALRKEIGGKHSHDVTLCAPEVQGDGINAARSIGASVDADVASPGFWTPVSRLKNKDGSTAIVPYGWLDRGRPGVIAVAPDGKRFVNESNPYHDICIGLFENGYPEDKRFFFICEEAFVKKRGMGDILPWPWTPSLDSHIRRGYIRKGQTLGDLAREIDIDSQALTDTVAQHNQNVKIGRDPEFNRGESVFNRTLGDASLGLKNPTLGPIKNGPFIALQIVPGTLGTSVGISTDAQARVLKEDGQAVPGLYACGSDATSMMAGVYPGAGITIGPAIVAAYLAVEHATKTPT
ncbi:FAD-dependent oxidoreductase [Pararhizobium sp. IMCC21322]|uniref:FAD-dependent oxidoreductase n=1 Tax=Pararhizobium sp. IMCC21322 TaxID=3067903 RepID=UPI002740CF1B|nr:FAD-dependent oxidoreductase [Pararhizobium sp. IMCC21322]